MYASAERNDYLNTGQISLLKLRYKHSEASLVTVILVTLLETSLRRKAGACISCEILLFLFFSFLAVVASC